MSAVRRLVLLCLITAVRSAAGQTPADDVALGDREQAAFHPAAALRHYEAAIAVDSNDYQALGKASRSAVDVGEGLTDAQKKIEMFRQGERYARRAIAANPNDPEGHFHLARALGRLALSVGVRDRVKYAVEIHDQAVAALKLDPDHPGALHVLGVWNAEVMRLSGFERFFAKNVLGGKILGAASWKDAVANLEHAVRVDPDRLTHRLDLALIYRDSGDKAKARAQLEFVLKAPESDVNDPLYKQQAEGVLAKLGGV